jgi:hypothetical protein
MRNKENGAVLLFVLICLAVILLGSAAMLSSSASTVNTTNNKAYKLAATSIAEVATADAMNYVGSLTMQTSLTSVANLYYAQKLPVDSHGIPVVTYDAGPPPSPACAFSGLTPCTRGAYSTTYVIERMCSNAGVASATNCQVTESQDTTSSVKDVTTKTNVAYRVTAWVTGPRGTSTVTQTVFFVSDLLA